MTIDVVLRLDDIGLFKKRRQHEQYSQYERACAVRDQFAECMHNALNGNGCVMPDLCANGDSSLHCAHLHVDYANFSGKGIPLTGRARSLIDARLRAIGTLVYRGQSGFSVIPKGSLAGDVHVAALQRISSFTGRRKSSGARAPVAKRAGSRKERSFVGRLLGSIF